MTDTTTTLSLEGLALANVFVTRQVVLALIANGVLSQQAMQSCFEAAKEELHRSTLSLSANDADNLLALIWRGFVPAGREEPH